MGFRNFRRAGTLKNRFFTEKSLPRWQATASLFYLGTGNLNEYLIRRHWNKFSVPPVLDGSDGSQSLSTKAHGMKAKQIGRVLNLGSGMTFKSHTGIRFRHTSSVINDTYTCFSGIRHQHFYIFCSGICQHSPPAPLSQKPDAV